MTNFEAPIQSKFPEEDTKEKIATEKQEKEEIRKYEHDLVVENPEFVGINFDHDDIINPRNLFSREEWLQYIEEWLQDIKEKDGKVPEKIQTIIGSGKAQEVILEKQKEEKDKIESFKKYLASFNGKLQNARVHPYGEFSPVAPSQAININLDGTYDVAIAPEFLDQMKMLREQTEILTIVIQFYDHRRGNERASDVPETPEQKDQYIALCEKIIEEIGNDIQLEIGNETNISKNTDEIFADISQHGSHVDPEEYGKFFFEVARKIKGKNSTVKLSIAGVACFDPNYLHEVLGSVKKLQTENKMDLHLVDTISFHPYREEPEKGAIEVKNGKFNISKLDYKEQLEEMQKIASEFGVELTVGEINFKSFDPEQKIKLHQQNKAKWEKERRIKLEEAISLTAEKGIKSFIYPGANYH